VKAARLLLCLISTIAASGTFAAESAGIAPPSIASPPGVVRVWGNAQTADIVARWSEQFARINPKIRVETNLTGSDIAMAGLYTGNADVALLGREATEPEVKAYEWVHRFKPSRVEILTGSVDRAGRSPALVVFVHKDNPLQSLTLAQLEAVFGHEHRLSSANIRSWDGLGLTGAWQGKQLRLYGPMAESGTGKFFRQRVLGDSNKMNWEQLSEFEDEVRTGAWVDDSGKRIVAALSKDPAGMAIGNLQFATRSVKAVPLRASADAEAVHATRASVGERRYPLSRPVYAYYSRPTGKAVDPQVGEFLRFALSDAGRKAITSSDGYLALDSERANTELRKLD